MGDGQNRWVAACALLLAAGSAVAGDGVIDLDSATHLREADLRPLVPTRDQPFAVLVQTAAGDVDTVSVRVDVDGSVHEYAASVVGSRGPYDVWRADVPAIDADAALYTVVLRDGAAAASIGRFDTAVGEETEGIGLDFVGLTHAPYGATPLEGGGVVFRVWAPNATSAAVRGAFNDWSATANPMTHIGQDWLAVVPSAAAGDMYKYFFNGNLWKPDPRARQLVESDNFNSRVIDPFAYEWQVGDFSPPPRDEMVIYQLHVGTFAGRNDPYGPTPSVARYRDVADRAEHLVELGINTVYLNPLNEWPGDRSGGYNPISAWAIEGAHGSPDDFKYMVDTLHAHGIAVVLDIVYNHVESNGNFLWLFDGAQAYYDDTAVDTPWGPQADVDNAFVRDYYVDAARMLLEEYRLDGFRQDAVFSLTGEQQSAGGQRLVRDIATVFDRRHADKINIAEEYSDNPFFTNPLPSGLGYDASYHEDFKNALGDAVRTYAFGGSNPDLGRLAASMDASPLSPLRRFNYWELHDDAWPLNQHQRAVRDLDPTFPHDNATARGLHLIAQGITLLSPGIPAILMGSEWLEDSGWESEKIDWSHRTTYAGEMAFHADLIGLRTHEPAFFADAPTDVLHVNDTAEVIAFERFLDDDAFVVAANFSASDQPAYRVPMPLDGRWVVVASSDEVRYGGMGAGLAESDVVSVEAVPFDGLDFSAIMPIPARSIVVLRHERGCSVADVSAPFGVLNFADVQAFLGAFNTGGASADIAAPAGVFNFADVQAFLGHFAEGCE